MTDRLDACLAFTLRPDVEGGWSDDPHDPGGATMRGVTLATFSAWLGRPATKAELRAITPAAERAIYGERFWNPLRCDALPPGVDLMVFDHGVNTGTTRSARILQSAAGATPDGHIGLVTLALVAKLPVGPLIDALENAQRGYYRGLAQFPRYGKGWLNRLGRRAALARTMAGPVKPAQGVQGVQDRHESAGGAGATRTVLHEETEADRLMRLHNPGVP